MTGPLEVDIKGFKATIQHDAARILQEPISNALDTEATSIVVDFAWSGGNATYMVTDNDRDGFATLKDAYTLFAPSSRKDDTSKRGRFGYGEKEFIALVYPGEVTIASTTGTVTIRGDERTVSHKKLESGSSISAHFRLSSAQAEEFIKRLNSILVPEGRNVELHVNVGSKGFDKYLEPRPCAKFEAVLATVVADEDGMLRPTRRRTEIQMVEPGPDETPHIYELGVPVVEYSGPYHVNIMQKVPLNRDRDNVTPAYRRELHRLLLEQLHSSLTLYEAKQAWVTEALPLASPEAVRDVVETIHGVGAVIYDPSNREATKVAIDECRTVVYGRQFSAEVWTIIRDNEILKPAGQVIQTGVPTSPDGKKPIPENQWTENMRRVSYYTRDVGQHLLGFLPTVEFHNLTTSNAHGHAWAWYGNKTITFNLRYLGKKWPDTVEHEELDALLLHEFTHDKVKDHYSMAFINELARLGAKLRFHPGRRVR